MFKEFLHTQTKDVIDEIIALRRKLHQNPEMSFQEYNTANTIEAFLQKEGIAFKRVANTGILAHIDGIEPTPENPVILRADMDALHITEATGLEFASVNKGVMHACGHDIHTACLAGTLKILNQNKDKFKGTVIGLFQPGEEMHPGGASMVLSEGIFNGMKPKAFIGQHVAPEIAAGEFGFKSGIYMASSDEIHLIVKGTGGHGGLPHTMTDPVIATANILVAMQQIVSRNTKASIPTVLSFGRLIADGATNIIPSEVFISGTLRTMDQQWRDLAKKRINEIAKGVCDAYGVEVEVTIKDGYPNVVNDPNLTQIVKKLCQETLGKDKVHELEIRMTAEDFGFYSQLYPCVFYRLGVGHKDLTLSGRLHTSTFTPSEDAIYWGILMMSATAFHFNEK